MKLVYLLLTTPLLAQQPGTVPTLPPELAPALEFHFSPAREFWDGSALDPRRNLDLPMALREALDELPEAYRIQAVPGTPPQTPPGLTPAVPPSLREPAAPQPAPAQAAKLRVQLTPGTLGVGDRGTLSIRIPDARRVESYPQIIEAEGLNIQFAGTSSQPYSLNGRIMRSMELQYQVEAMDPGTRTIPAQNLTVDGTVYTTLPLEVVVSEGQPVDESLMPQVQLTTGKTEIWEGEEVPISVSVLLHGGLQITSQPFPVIKSEGVAVSRFDRHGRTEATEINGQYWTAWRMPSSMIALKPGELEFGPAEVKLEVLMPLSGAQRDPFGSFPSARRTLRIQSNTIKVRVKPLPSEGKPAGFTGLVGSFQLAARADNQSTGPQTVELGDPVGFEIAVTGTGNFDSVTAPALENSEGLRAYKPKTSMENRGYGQEFGQKTFTQIIFAEKPGPRSVVFMLPHFDPASGKYVTAKSTPVELIVTGSLEPPATVATDNAAADSSRDFSPMVKTPVPGEELTDILPQAVEGGRWFSTAATLAPVHPLLLHGAPAALLAALLGIGAARRIRAWSLAHRPPPGAPRPCADIVRDLHRSGLSRLQFYGFVSEYTHAWEYWKRSPLPAHDAQLAPVLAARDHWLYATNAEPAAAPVPDTEQSQTVSVLTSRLAA
jgi:hypothetical protein